MRYSFQNIWFYKTENQETLQGSLISEHTEQSVKRSYQIIELKTLFKHNSHLRTHLD